MKNTLKEIEQALQKAEKYDNVRQRDVTIAKTLLEAASALTRLARELDPVIKLEGQRRHNNGYREEVVGKVLANLQAGREYLISQVESEFDLNYSDAQQVMAALTSNHKVLTRRDVLSGRQKIFYLQKPTRDE